MIYFQYHKIQDNRYKNGIYQFWQHDIYKVIADLEPAPQEKQEQVYQYVI